MNRGGSSLLFLLIVFNVIDANSEGFLSLPFKDKQWIITQGWRYNAPLNVVNISDPYKHEAVDYNCPQGTRIVAAASGLARSWYQYNNENYGYGEYVLIDHQNGFFTLYAHLGEISPKIARLNVGSNKSFWTQINRGEFIGKSGNSGTGGGGYHLHFEVSTMGYATGRTDPYDVYSTAEDYPPNGQMGQNHLWLTNPPSPPDNYYSIGEGASSRTLKELFTAHYNAGHLSGRGSTNLGQPTSVVNSSRNWEWQRFAGGNNGESILFYNPNTNSEYLFLISGSILEKYEAIGGYSVIGAPTSDQTRALNSPHGTTGHFQYFSSGSAIYLLDSSPQNSLMGKTLLVLPGILAEYENQGFSAGRLGFPVSDEYDGGNGWRRQDFEGGYIRWKQDLGAQTIFNTDISSLNHTYNLTKGFNLISFPFNPSPTLFSEIFNSIGNNLDPYIFFLDDLGNITYGEKNSLHAKPQKGYFLYLNNPQTITVTGTKTSPGLTLYKGYNLIGVSVYEGKSHIIPSFNNNVDSSAFYLNSISQMDLVDIFNEGMVPGVGYFVYSNTSNNPLINDSGSNIKSINKIRSPKDTSDHAFVSQASLKAMTIIGDDFTGAIRMTQTNAPTPVELEFGIKPDATEDRDQYDEIPFPPFPGNLYGDIDGFKKSMKSPGSEREWELSVTSQTKYPGQSDNLNPVQISWTIPLSGSINQNTHFQLIDKESNLVVVNGSSLFGMDKGGEASAYPPSGFIALGLIPKR